MSKMRKRPSPIVTLKAALTLDGRMATSTGDSKWITGPRARQEAHRIRSRSDAILTGIGTVLADDPELTVRHVRLRGSPPLRVVLDSKLRIAKHLDAKILDTRRAPTLVLHGPRARNMDIERVSKYCEVVAVGEGEGRRVDLCEVLLVLADRGCVNIVTEAGSELHGALLREGLIQRVALFFAPKLLGDAAARPLSNGPPILRMADAHKLSHVRVRRFGDDWLVEGSLV